MKNLNLFHLQLFVLFLLSSHLSLISSKISKLKTQTTFENNESVNNQDYSSSLHSKEWNYYMDRISEKKSVFMDRIISLDKKNEKTSKMSNLNSYFELNTDKNKTTNEFSNEANEVERKSLIIEIVLLYFSTFIIFTVLAFYKNIEEAFLLKLSYAKNKYNSFINYGKDQLINKEKNNANDINSKNIDNDNQSQHSKSQCSKNLDRSMVSNSNSYNLLKKNFQLGNNNSNLFINDMNIYTTGKITIEKSANDEIFRDFYSYGNSIALSRVIEIENIENKKVYTFDHSNLNNVKTNMIKNTSIFQIRNCSNLNDESKENNFDIEFPKFLTPEFFPSTSFLNGIKLSNQQLKNLKTKEKISVRQRENMEEIQSNFCKIYKLKQIAINSDSISVESISQPNKFIARVCIYKVSSL